MKAILAILLILSATQAHALVRHFVAFRYRADVTEAQKQTVREHFFTLKELCHKPDGSSYVLSIEAGLANSPEGADQKFEDGYLVTFANKADRDYYVGRPFSTPYDPAHDAFKSFVGPLLDSGGAFVFDYETSGL